MKDRLQNKTKIDNNLETFIRDHGWRYFSKKMRKDRRKKLLDYGKQYYEPILNHFPELFGQVSLTVRKYGWLAKYSPSFHIIIREEDLDNSSPWRIRSITAHELIHFLQFQQGVGINKKSHKQKEQQATFLTFARGFAFDFVKAFIAECRRIPCDHRFRFSYIRCDCIFSVCCRTLTKSKLYEIATCLEKLAQEYGSWHFHNYEQIIRYALCNGK